MPARGTPASAGAWCEQRVSERAVRVAGAGMHDQARRLVDHDDRVVLEHDRERKRLRAA